MDFTTFGLKKQRVFDVFHDFRWDFDWFRSEIRWIFAPSWAIIVAAPVQELNAATFAVDKHDISGKARNACSMHVQCIFNDFKDEQLGK